MHSPHQPSPADAIPCAEAILARLAEIARERQVLRGLLRLARLGQTPARKPAAPSNKPDNVAGGMKG